MSLESFSKFATLLTEFDVEIKTEIPTKLRCIQCCQVLANAHQAPCGCKMCRACIDKMIEKGIKMCSGISQFCEQADLANCVPDYKTNTRISKLTVKCINPSCFHECSLVSLEDHLRVCSKRTTRSDSVDEDEQLKLMNCEDCKVLVKWICNLKREMATLKANEENGKNEMEFLKQKLLKKEEKLELMSQQIQTLEDRIKKNEDETQSMWKQMISSTEVVQEVVNVPVEIARGWQPEKIQSANHEIMYTITNIDSFRQKSYYGEYSDVSISNDNRCKFQLVAWNGGDDLWVYLRVYSTDTDDGNRWPFEADVTITISNSNSPTGVKTVTKFCRLDKPPKNSCLSSEVFAFPYSDLSQCGLLSDNATVVSCVVETRPANCL